MGRPATIREIVAPAGDDTNASQERRAIFPIAPAIRAARPSISRWCGAPTPARYGLAVRLLQPEIMAIGHERERSGAAEPRAARRGDDRGGFRPYDREWWHFTLNNEPFPDTYFDFPVR